MPHVSIIVPCYNQGRFLADCLGSLFAQSFADWECVIVDDGSTDDSAEVAKSWTRKDARIRCVVQENRGLSGARNTGVKASQGEFLQFLDSDDKLETDKLRHQVAFLNAHSKVDIVYGDARYFTTENPELRLFGLDGANACWKANEAWIPQLWNSGRPILSILVERNIMPVNASLLRRSVSDAVGVWEESMRAAEDWDYWLRCAARGLKYQYIDPPNSMALIRTHASSMSRDNPRMAEGCYKFRIRFGQHVENPDLRLINYRYGRALLDALPGREKHRRHLALRPCK